MDLSQTMTSAIERLHQTLARRLPQPLDAVPPLVRASVLVPIFVIANRPHLLFTRRTEEVLTHKGQISFPGGQQEAGDQSGLQTALRETYEEIGLHPARVEPLGELDDVPSAVSGFIVSPFVGLVSGTTDDLRPAPSEVKSLLLAPIDVLLDPAVHHAESRTWQGAEHVIHFYTVGDDVIWGLTGYILSQFLALWAAR